VADTTGTTSAGADEPLAAGGLGHPGRRQLRLSTSSGVMIVLFAVFASLAVRVFVDAHRPLSWAAAAVVGAAVLDPVVDVLARRIRRVPAVLLCFLVAGAVAVGLAYLAFDDLGRAVDRLEEAAPEAAAGIEERDDRIGQIARDLRLADRIDDAVEALEERFGDDGGSEVLRSTALTAPAYLAGAILTVFMMSYGPKLGQAALDQLPARRRRRIAPILGQAVGRARRAGMLAVAHSVAIGLLAGAGAWALDLPAPAALGMGAGVAAFLPHLGVVLGSTPILLLALGFRSATVALLVLAIAIALQLFDSLVLRRHIHLLVEMGLLVPFVAAVLLHATYGVGAVVFGLAYVIFLTAVLDELAGSVGEANTVDG
jgi:predicted PurR-regulated permease PerM